MNANTTQNGLGTVAQNIASKKWSFLAAFLITLFVVVSVCMATGFIPNTPETNQVATASTESNVFSAVSTSSLIASAAGATPIMVASSNGASAPVTGALNMNGDLPVKIVVKSIGLDAKVANPATTDIEALDSYLLKGAARYPTSATLDQQGNVILFGHSSYLPVVINQAYKTFNGIQKLAKGDQITVYSATKEYVYAVTSVQQESATSDFSIPLTTTGHTLTLATCDSFGKKTDRFVVTATLVGSYALGS